MKDKYSLMDSDSSSSSSENIK